MSDPETAATSDDDAAPAEPDTARPQRAGRTPWWRRGLALLVAGVLVTGLAVAGAVLVITRDDDEPAGGSRSGAAGPTSAQAAAAAQAFLAGATSDIAAVTSYDYRSLDVALQAGSAVTTGQYRQAYRAAIQGPVGTAARAQQIVQTFRQTAAGIGSLTTDLRTAKVLIFGVQTVRRGSADPQDARITLTATMQRQGDRYLVSKLEAGTNAGIPLNSARVAAAAEAARRHVLATLTLRRASLNADYAAALAGTVAPLRTSLPDTLAASVRAVGKGQYDRGGRVTAIAIERADQDRVIVLVAAAGYRIANGVTTVDTDARLRINVLYVGGAWQVSDSRSADE